MKKFCCVFILVVFTSLVSSAQTHFIEPSLGINASPFDYIGYKVRPTIAADYLVEFNYSYRMGVSVFAQPITSLNETFFYYDNNTNTETENIIQHQVNQLGFAAYFEKLFTDQRNALNLDYTVGASLGMQRQWTKSSYIKGSANNSLQSASTFITGNSSNFRFSITGGLEKQVGLGILSFSAELVYLLAPGNFFDSLPNAFRRQQASNTISVLASYKIPIFTPLED